MLHPVHSSVWIWAHVVVTAQKRKFGPFFVAVVLLSALLIVRRRAVG